MAYNIAGIRAAQLTPAVRCTLVCLITYILLYDVAKLSKQYKQLRI